METGGSEKPFISDLEMNIRLIPRLDVKMAYLIKGIQMEGWRKYGDPADRAEQYYLEGADEILYLDVVASLYERNNLHEIVKGVASKTFIPITAGGGIATLSDAKLLMEAGADKIAVNTAATRRPEFLRELSEFYGSQAVVLNLEVKRRAEGGWTVMTDNGRNHTHRDAISWAAEAVALGVGEILVSSVDQDGTKKGMDLDLIQAVSRAVDVPIIASGGCACTEHACSAVDAGADAVSIGAALHSNNLRLIDLRSDLLSKGYPLRPFLMS